MESRKSRKTPICSRFCPKNPDMFPIKSLEKSGPGREHIGTRPGTYRDPAGNILGTFQKILANFSTFSYSNQCYCSANFAAVVLNYSTYQRNNPSRSGIEPVSSRTPFPMSLTTRP